MEASRWSALQARVEVLEANQAFQEDLVAALNQQVAALSLEVRRLWDAKRLLAERVKEMREPDMQRPEDEAPPPHY